MKAKNEIRIPAKLVESTVKSIMENFPEASSGSSLVCTGWKYEAWRFRFTDQETGKKYETTREQLLNAFALVYSDKWPKGCTQPPARTTEESMDEWLCQCDATDFDAFIQLALLGEVIYG